VLRTVSDETALAASGHVDKELRPRVRNAAGSLDRLEEDFAAVVGG
jgi:hypothetical protein